MGIAIVQHAAAAGLGVWHEGRDCSEVQVGPDAGQECWQCDGCNGWPDWGEHCEDCYTADDEDGAGAGTFSLSLSTVNFVLVSVLNSVLCRWCRCRQRFARRIAHAFSWCC